MLLGQPAAWSVPAALATMVVVSLATRDRVPAHADRFMVRLHTPEAVALDAAEPDRSSYETDRWPIGRPRSARGCRRAPLPRRPRAVPP